MTLSATMTLPATAKEAGIRALEAVTGAVLCAAAFGPLLAASAAIGMIWREQAISERFATICIVFAGAGAIAAFIAWLLAAALAGHRQTTVRFATFLVLVTVGTAGAIALSQFIAYETMDVEPEPKARLLSIHFLYMQASAAAGAIYVTLSTGLRLVLPQGLLPLFAGALAFALLGGAKRG